MTDPTLSALAFIGMVFAGAAAARLLLRATLVLGAVLRDLTASSDAAATARFHPLDLPKAA